LRYPQNLSHLLLVDTGGENRWAQENASQVLAQRGFSPEIVNLARRFFNGQIEPNEMFPALMKLPYTYHINPSRAPQLIITGLKSKLRPEALIYGETHFLKGWTVMDQLGEIKAPTLVMAGSEDFIYPPESVKELAARIPNARLEIIERASHSPHIEQPAQVLRLVRDFLADAKTGGA
jgi:proline iminopeptidase